MSDTATDNWVKETIERIERLTDEGYQEIVERHKKEEFRPAAHKTEITTCYVMENDLGERTYGLYVEDQKGLKKPIGIEIVVDPDGSVSVAEYDALDILVYLKPEVAKQIDEEYQREKASRQKNST